MTKTPAAKDPTRNVWLQLGFPDAEEHFLKAELVLRLDKAITSLGLTQRAAARRIGATQPELSKILGGKFTEVSLERLMRFLTGSRLPYRNQNWGRAGKQGGRRHHQGCPTHGCVKRSRPPRDAAAGCGIRQLWKSLGCEIAQNRRVARSERFELPTLGFEVRCSIQLSYERVRGLDYQTWPDRASTPAAGPVAASSHHQTPQAAQCPLPSADHWKNPFLRMA
jgi:predicted XRE-type DNA-binding protein